jgi:hypothetical protein
VHVVELAAARERAVGERGVRRRGPGSVEEDGALRRGLHLFHEPQFRLDIGKHSAVDLQPGLIQDQQFRRIDSGPGDAAEHPRPCAARRGRSWSLAGL